MVKENRMLYLTKEGLYDKKDWEGVQIGLPEYDIEAVKQKTEALPQWVHFGAGNIFRAYIALLQQRLLNEGYAQTGIVAVNAAGSATFDCCYTPYDNLSLIISMGAEGNLKKEVLGNITDALEADFTKPDWQRLSDIFKKPSLQMASFTVTEKSYATTDGSGVLLETVRNDIDKGPLAPTHLLSAAAALLYVRFCAGAQPIALVSMDNCAKNGDRLKRSILLRAEGWQQCGYVPKEFVSYLRNEQCVAFPWSMIDKIVPAPSVAMREHLTSLGVQAMDIKRTRRGTMTAPFVNAEEKGYLVIEDHFPNGRPLLEKTGVYFTDKQTVNKAEKMKVGTCLNPLHTALALFGCLFGYTCISEEMQDEEIVCFIRRMAEDEGMPVVEHPGILDPEEFLKEVLEERFPNPYIPDTPQRIAADTSQKIPVRFGETLKKYQTQATLNISNLKFIPFVFALWLRYLLGKDDDMNPMEISPEPMLPFLSETLIGVTFGKKIVSKEKIAELLRNSDIFGIDLVEAKLSGRVFEYLERMLEGKHSVRRALQEILKL